MYVVNKIGDKKKVLRLGKFDTETQVIEETRKGEKKELSRSLSAVNFAMDLGFSISIPIAGGTLLGVYLDQKFQTSPKLTLSFLFFGLFIGIYTVYKMVKEIN